MNKKLYSKLIFDHSHPGRRGYALPDYGYEKAEALPAHLTRAEAPSLPEVDEPTLVRHYTTCRPTTSVSTPASTP